MTMAYPEDPSGIILCVIVVIGFTLWLMGPPDQPLNP